MSTTKVDSRRVNRRQDLQRLGTAKGANLEAILDNIDVEADAPLRMFASLLPNSTLNFSSSVVNSADNAKEIVSPVKKQIFSAISNPSINFQTQAVSNAADFDITFPTSTVAFYRYAGFTLVAPGKIKVLWSNQNAVLTSLANPGALFVSGGLPIGYIALQCTNALGYFRTASSIDNRLLFTEQRDNAAWVKTRSFVTANAVIAPDGTTTADKLFEDTTATNSHLAVQTVTTAVNAAYTYSVYLKAAERSHASLLILNNAAVANNVAATFNLKTGKITALQNNGNATGAIAIIEELPDGWWRCSISGTPGTSGTVVAVQLRIHNGTVNSYTGDGVSGIYTWGDQLTVGTVVTAYKRNVAAILPVIENADIYRFGSGAGGGSGTGDASAFATDMKIRLLSSFYEFVTPVEFSIDEQTLVGSATAAFDSADSVYLFSSAAQNLVSVNMFNDEFLANDEDSRRVELHAQWLDSASRDDAAIYEASLNGTNYETIAMTRQGLSQRFTGDKLLAIPANSLLYTQATQTTQAALNTSTVQFLAKKVTVTTKSALRSLVFGLVKTGSPLGSYIVSIVKDVSNTPTGDVLYSTIGSCSSLSAGTNVITLSDFRVITPPGVYWITVKTDAAYQASYSAGVTQIAPRTTTGSELAWNGTAWVSTTANMFYQLLGHIYDLKVRVTSSASGKKLQAFGVFYDEQQGDVVTGVQALQKFRFSGNSNVTSFAITQFLPDANNLKVYDISSGQVYRHPAFNIDGHTVTFASGTFAVPGETIELIFDQSNGSGFDNSDSNANLMAANHLGSTDATLDKSINGRGILIRNSAGELKEIWLDASNNLNITDPL